MPVDINTQLTPAQIEELTATYDALRQQYGSERGTFDQGQRIADRRLGSFNTLESNRETGTLSYGNNRFYHNGEIYNHNAATGEYVGSISGRILNADEFTGTDPGSLEDRMADDPWQRILNDLNNPNNPDYVGPTAAAAPTMQDIGRDGGGGEAGNNFNSGNTNEIAAAGQRGIDLATLGEEGNAPYDPVQTEKMNPAYAMLGLPGLVGNLGYNQYAAYAENAKLQTLANIEAARQRTLDNRVGGPNVPGTGVPSINAVAGITDPGGVGFGGAQNDPYGGYNAAPPGFAGDDDDDRYGGNDRDNDKGGGGSDGSGEGGGDGGGGGGGGQGSPGDGDRQ